LTLKFAFAAIEAATSCPDCGRLPRYRWLPSLLVKEPLSGPPALRSAETATIRGREGMQREALGNSSGHSIVPGFDVAALVTTPVAEEAPQRKRASAVRFGQLMNRTASLAR